MESIILSSIDIEGMETNKRVNFMNSLTGFKSGSVIGTVDLDGSTNLAVFSSVIHLGSNPALVGFISRPAKSVRHTYENILATGCFSINHINKDNYKQAHQTAARYPKDVSEFDATGLTPEYIKDFKAPFVKESHIKYGLEFLEEHKISNGTILIIGQVMEVIIPPDYISVDGMIDLVRAGTLTISGLDSYLSTNKIARLSYAKPDRLPTEIA